MNHKNKILIIFFSVALFLGLIILINIFVNPYGFYGESQKKIEILNSRNLKFNHLKNSESNYEAFVFGSSNSMRFSPNFIEKKTNLKTYNYGVFYATAEDYYCLPKTLYEIKSINPKLIIFCLDVFSFKKAPKTFDEVFKGARNRLSYYTRASKYLPDFSNIKLNWYRIKSALTFKQTLISVKAIINGNFKNLSLKEIYSNGFTVDGCRKKYANFEGRDITETAEKGNYDIEEYIKIKDLEFQKQRNGQKGIVSVTGDYDFEGLSVRRLHLFESIINFLNKKDCKVVINIMPVEPYFYSLLTKRTKHEKNIQSLNDFCISLTRKYPNLIVVKNNSHINNFNGQKNHFFDQYHPTNINSSLMIKSLNLDKIDI